jgi:DNA-binding CsgD family transcriptional regulator
MRPSTTSPSGQPFPTLRDLVQDAARQPERWSAFLQALSDALDTVGAALVPIDPRISAARQALADAVDRLLSGVAVLDRKGRLLDCNPIATQIFSADDGLRVRERMLEAPSGHDTRRLRRYLAAAAAETSAGQDVGCGCLLLSRPSGRRPFVLTAAPVARRPLSGVDLPSDPAILLFIHDPALVPASAERRLRELFALSPAEARVAVALLDGEPVEAVAAQLHISAHTARSHLQSIYAKTGTNRQSALVRLLLAACGAPLED